MPTSTRFVVSIHTLALLARNAGKPLRSEKIAADVGTNSAVIRALLSRLQAVNLTTSQRGQGGGALLAQPAAEIRLLDVYLTMENRELFAFHDMLSEAGKGVGRYVLASLTPCLYSAREAMERELAGVTIQDIVDGVALRERESVAPGLKHPCEWREAIVNG